MKKVVETVQGHLVKNKSCLIVCGTYTIGEFLYHAKINHNICLYVCLFFSKVSLPL